MAHSFVMNVSICFMTMYVCIYLFYDYIRAERERENASIWFITMSTLGMCMCCVRAFMSSIRVARRGGVFSGWILVYSHVF